ncbi:MAG: phosphoribosylanthranilate isomerase [Candidatus Acidiferrum sp.]
MIHIKICGITNLSDALAAREAGANSLGFNFYSQSRRHIPPAEAARIRLQLPENTQIAGVFVNTPSPEVQRLCALVRLDAVQLHGDEPPAQVTELAGDVPVIKAFRVGPEFSLDTLAPYRAAFAFLLDAALPGQYGGTGHTTDWALARRAANTRRIILAGGLTLENVAAAIAAVRPYGVDAASGVEAHPGKKDHGRLSEFIQEVRRAEKYLTTQPESFRA